ncbi:MAG TPA: orotate phosphoribosyltransferase [Longimicrobiales bacterium]|nr:orotate phosphoribosyltransferase [Longimicrobiales bacterium]
MERSTDLAQLHELLKEKSVKRGDFTLASGKKSSFYVDARLTTMSGRGQVLIGRMGLCAIDEAGWKPAAVGGLTLGADPIAYAIAHAASNAGRTLDAFTVRKEAKGHGAGKLIEGGFVPGMSVVVVEDVITTGDSALRAAASLRENGGNVLGVLAVVDREEGGAERIQEAGYSVISLACVSEVL